MLVTHDQDEALSLADRVAVIRSGRVCQIDTPQGLYDAPADTDVAGFVGEANLFPGVFLDGSVRTVLGDLAVHCRAGIRRTGADAVVLIRPEQIKLCPAAPAAVGAGRILDLEYHGHDSVVRVTADSDGWAPGDPRPHLGPGPLRGGQSGRGERRGSRARVVRGRRGLLSELAGGESGGSAPPVSSQSDDAPSPHSVDRVLYA